MDTDERRFFRRLYYYASVLRLVGTAALRFMGSLHNFKIVHWDHELS